MLLWVRTKWSGHWKFSHNVNVKQIFSLLYVVHCVEVVYILLKNILEKIFNYSKLNVCTYRILHKCGKLLITVTGTSCSF